MKKMTLPSKPSELIFVALRDLEAVENTPGYKVNMGEWHKVVRKGQEPYWESEDNRPVKHCEVCFAGSVMAKTLKVDNTQEADPYTIESMADDADFIFDYDKASKLRKLSGKLQALNSFRIGAINEGLSEMDISDKKRMQVLKELDLLEITGVDLDMGTANVEVTNLKVADYKRDPAQFKIDMETLAGYLSSVGL